MVYRFKTKHLQVLNMVHWYNGLYEPRGALLLFPLIDTLSPESARISFKELV